MLEELGLAYELRPVPVISGEQFTSGSSPSTCSAKCRLVDPELGAPLAASGAILF